MLKPLLARIKLNCLPIPSVAPVTTTHEPFPYLFYKSKALLKRSLYKKFITLKIFLETAIIPTKRTKFLILI